MKVVHASALSLFMNRTFSNFVRWLSAAVLIAIGLWNLNLVAFHIWAADRFLSGSQEVSDWHQKWALIFLGISLIALIGAGAIIWRLLSRTKVSSETSE